MSNDPSATTASYGDWVLRCVKVQDQAHRVCEVSQSIMVEGQTAPLAQVAVGRVAPAGALRLTVALPNNVALTSVPKVSTGEDDKQPVTMTWQRCLPGGCLADATFTDALRDRWRKSTVPASVAFTDGGGRPIAVPVSLRGLSQALDALGSN